VCSYVFVFVCEGVRAGGALLCFPSCWSQASHHKSQGLLLVHSLKLSFFDYFLSVVIDGDLRIRK